jgi:hypothetical protein
VKDNPKEREEAAEEDPEVREETEKNNKPPSQPNSPLPQQLLD